MNSSNKQSGFILMLFTVVVSIVVALWLSTQHRSVIAYFKNQQIENDFTELELVKERLLQFAVLQPELYKTNGGGDPLASSQIPSPGYFPCPDLDGDGVLLDANYETQCTNPYISGNFGTGYVPDFDLAAGLGTCDGSQVCIGFVPREIGGRNFYFAETGRYLYFLDERFAFQNNNYNGSLERFAPLNPVEFDPEDADLENDPVLQLNGESGYIVLIIDPGADGLDAVNLNAVANAQAAATAGTIPATPSFVNFVSGADDMNNSTTADQIVGITYEEWLALMAHRVCIEKQRFEGLDASFTEIDPGDKHWYNAYNASTNPNGSDWRAWARVCP